MKKIKIFLLAVFTIMLLGIPAVAETTGKGKAEFGRKTYDFGELKEGNKPVSHEFEFTNTGDANLVILGATADCGCTKPEFPKAPLPPGKTGRIKVTFNPAGFRGAFEKGVTVRTNGQPKKVKLKIKGIIK